MKASSVSTAVVVVVARVVEVVDGRVVDDAVALTSLGAVLDFEESDGHTAIAVPTPTASNRSRTAAAT
ncbi:MAG: hypothetical protein ACXWCM_02830 [Acidimicrobiales bacterium]